MKYDNLYMDWAIRISKESKCPRKQVGCVILLESGLIAPGFNGHASSGPNEWEYDENGNPEVVHAELNALGKLLEQGVSAKDAIVFLTLSPCLECAKLLVRARVKRVVFLEEYRRTEGIDYLSKYGVKVERYNEKFDSSKSEANNSHDWPTTMKRTPVARYSDGVLGDRITELVQDMQATADALAEAHAENARLMDELQGLRLRALNAEVESANAERQRCLSIIRNYEVSVGNSAAGELAADWTIDALLDICDEIESGS